MDQLRNEERIVTVREIVDVLAQHLRPLLFFILTFFCLGAVFVFFKAPVFQSSALLKISATSGSDSLLSKIAGGDRESYFANNAELSSEQYILTSQTVLENAVKNAHLDIVATPTYFPLIGRAYANHHTNFQDLSAVEEPFLWFSSYSWGGGFIAVPQLVIPPALINHPFSLIYKGSNQYDVLYQDRVIIHGTVGVLSSGILNNQPIQMLVSGISANVGARFSIKQQPLAIAINVLKKQLKVGKVEMTDDLLKVDASGVFNQQLQNRLEAVIDSAIQLSIQIRVQKAKKILSFLEQQIPTVKNHLDNLNQAMSNTLPIGVQFSSMAREKSIQNLMYTNMLMDIEQYELQKASSLGKIAVVTPPTDMAPYVGFSGIETLLIAILLGALLGVIFVFARHYIFGIVYTTEQIERVTGLPVMGSLQLSKEQTAQRSLYQKSRIPQLQLLFEKDENDITLEGFRSLRTHLFLNYLSGAHTNKIIAVSGPIPNIGKSFVAVNLAQQLAHMGKKVLLIDADIRKGSLWEYFCDTRPVMGFIDLLRNADQKNAVRQTRVKNLDFLPSGELNIRHIELLLRDRVEMLLKRYANEYDCIVIDTAPVFAVSDALGICRYSDINLLTFAYGKHNEKDVDNVVKKFENANIKLHGFVMNMMELSALGYKYGYYKYGYQYRMRDKEKA